MKKFEVVEVKLDASMLELIEETHGSVQKWFNLILQEHAWRNGFERNKIRLPKAPKKKYPKADHEKAKKIVIKLVELIGGGFHPDNHMEDYTTGEWNSSTPSFDEKTCKRLNKKLDFAWKVLGDEIYTVGLNHFKAKDKAAAKRKTK